MAKNIIISCESCSDLNPELIKKNKIHIFPMPYTIGTKNFIDDGTLSPSQIYEEVKKNNALPKTSAITLGIFLEEFPKLLKKADAVIHISISKELSSCFSSAVLASKEIPNVYAIDSLRLSSGIGMQILEACKLRDEGKSVKEIIAGVEKVRAVTDVSFLIDDLEYLYKGGRCTGLAFFFARGLHLRPTIVLNNEGKMDVDKKFIGAFRKKLFDYIDYRLEKATVDRNDFAFITHAGVDEDIVKSVVEYVKAKNIFADVFVTVASATICSHCGKNTLGIIFKNYSQNAQIR
ncbi:MAG: DegV family protein [Bacillales bacterium]|jgi:DegV family protein with EDD domain|nr:DegV family protein [Bacillales bacterium]